ncbi:probable tyrosyl-DNA phosphodiesterase isoform X1 [Scaptodrosophila lebanonensis]|uniref:Probable tyrosyl-DNA phosphodiesterase isoform X1 n=2 Tax=Drosophila lebanonensis TaxID=7225 RepID=A0A6J2U327_DROLE|nr:probable tyrosyl-DNA phosphodiesterase isoform X1 [Scaptodrosophila lebanonensis]
MQVCPYGEKCYRKNPIHFSEYSHAHLDAIYAKGSEAGNNGYDIPPKYSTELINIQLKLLEKVFPKETQKQSAGPAPTTSSKQPTTSVKQPTTSASTTSRACSSGNSKGSSSSSTNDTSNLAKKQKLTERNIRDYIPVVVEGRMADKLAAAAPYNMFLTAITDSKPTHKEPLSVTLQEILDESMGEIESTVQINFMVDIGWLLGHYYFAGILDKPLLVLYGDESPELLGIGKFKPQVTAIKVNMPTPFATSHTKMMLLGYADGSMRVVISTANLYEDDWHNRTQGLWISPRLDPLPEGADTAAGESPTGFKQDLMLYLVEYKLTQLQPWIARIRKSDFSAINVFFIGSVPGGHRESTTRGHPWGHARLGSLLAKHAAPVDDRIPVICQSSSIGSLGANVQTWIQQDVLNSLRKDSSPLGRLRQLPPFKMIYPSFGNVASSHDGMLGGGCLPYSKNTNDKQPWLKSYLQQWKSSDRYRSQAMPHIKSYTRFNLEEQCAYWFVLTSANLSKAAWGSFNKNSNIQPILRIANYEAGVLFLPRFVTGEDTFPLVNARDGIPAFPLPYDVPLTPYGPDDTPFLMDYLHT